MKYERIQPTEVNHKTEQRQLEEGEIKQIMPSYVLSEEVISSGVLLSQFDLVQERLRPPTPDNSLKTLSPHCPEALIHSLTTQNLSRSERIVNQNRDATLAYHAATLLMQQHRQSSLSCSDELPRPETSFTLEYSAEECSSEEDCDFTFHCLTSQVKGGHPDADCNDTISNSVAGLSTSSTSSAMEDGCNSSDVSTQPSLHINIKRPAFQQLSRKSNKKSKKASHSAESPEFYLNATSSRTQETLPSSAAGGHDSAKPGSVSIGKPLLRIPPILPLPKSLFWTKLDQSVWADDQKVLKFLPYFGDDDKTSFDMADFQQKPWEMDAQLGGEVLDLVVFLLSCECGSKAAGFSPGSCVCVVSQELGLGLTSDQLEAAFSRGKHLLRSLDYIKNIVLHSLATGAVPLKSCAPLEQWYPSADRLLHFNDLLDLFHACCSGPEAASFPEALFYALKGANPGGVVEPGGPLFRAECLMRGLGVKARPVLPLLLLPFPAPLSVSFLLPPPSSPPESSLSLLSKLQRCYELQRERYVHPIAPLLDSFSEKSGLKQSSTSFADLSENVRFCFCRRCYRFGCELHGLLQPYSSTRHDPVRPYLNKSESSEGGVSRLNFEVPVSRQIERLQSNKHQNAKKIRLLQSKLQRNCLERTSAAGASCAVAYGLYRGVFSEDEEAPSQQNSSSGSGSRQKIECGRNESFLLSKLFSMVTGRPLFDESSDQEVLPEETLVDDDQSSTIARLLGTCQPGEVNDRLHSAIAVLSQLARESSRGTPGNPSAERVAPPPTADRDALVFTCDFQPCKHSGSCSKEHKCVCVTNHGWCEKFCTCPLSCKNRFPGCKCNPGGCKTSACPCRAAGRECDPDLCLSCGVAVHPALLCQETHKSSNFQPCHNFPVRQGIGKTISIGRSDIHGFGCFLREDCKKDEFITEYLGEVVSQEEGNRRGKCYDKKNCTFLFNRNDDSVIDAMRMGSLMKFVNHCNEKPSCYAIVRHVNAEHRVALFAGRDIKAGEELTFDYNAPNSNNSFDQYWYKQ